MTKPRVTGRQVFWITLAYEAGKFVWAVIEMLITGRRKR